jgi:oligoendopeptidase F
MTWGWAQLAPYYDDLAGRTLTDATVADWLADWTALAALVDEANTRFIFATTADTADAEMERRFRAFVEDVQPNVAAAEQRLKQKLLASGLEPRDFEIPLRKLRADAALFREENLPLIAEERKMLMEYHKIAGARTVQWEGQEIPVLQLAPVQLDPDRARRERAWRTASGRIVEDTDALAAVWRRLVELRTRIAANAGFASYRAYRWQQLFRFDYTPEDTLRFHDAIAEVVVPAVRRLDERRRERLGVPSLRIWDPTVDPAGRTALRPYATIAELEEKTTEVFRRVDPQFAAYFATMRAEGLLDLASRKNKAPGGYSVAYEAIHLPIIYTNAVGTHDDVQTLLHEGGHAFHTFEMARLPYLQQRSEAMVPIEFAEVASMGMELLASPYLTARDGGFYTEAEAARARIEHLETNIRFWPYMAMIDALQHWVYEHPAEGADMERCDDVWSGLVDRFWPGFDWSGLEREKRTYWHRQGHPFDDPFYYVEYGIAQLGATQVWGNALRDQAGAVADYRRALALGATATLPDLYAAAGVRFAFDAATLRQAVALTERVIAELEPIAAT